MDDRRRRAARIAALRAAFAGELALRGLDRAIAEDARIEPAPYSGILVTHAASYAPGGRDSFTVEDQVETDFAIAACMDAAVARIVLMTAHRREIRAACERIRQRFDEAFAGTGVRARDIAFNLHEPYGRPTTTASVAYAMLDDMLEETDCMLTLHDPHDEPDPERDPLIALPARQRKRAKLLGDGDPHEARMACGFLARAVRALPPEQAYPMLERIDAMQSRGEENDDHEGNGMTWLHYRDGILGAILAVGPGTLEEGMLTLPGAAVPEQVVVHLAGLKARAVIDHPLVADRRILSAEQDDEGLRLRLAEPKPVPLRHIIQELEDAE